ncbi:hypothetical protein SPACI_035370 [Sporomusa acidovorans DSM 3132]|uniref:Uncharacterized protein n=1 Tax=Sporomusa acidovorans (strain ATCC 49682 / DSM 3132 / Mol) TaxID=1123286 RepID=A0ABZ3J5X3_SPOA4|nr:hypothetical protein SPACI_35180 [Sporomusa acidovorans DSM 3132]SDF25773.1 hypothetical protein SAMN04488499_104017 [Sporomusa acidovorans]
MVSSQRMRSMDGANTLEENNADFWDMKALLYLIAAKQANWFRCISDIRCRTQQARLPPGLLIVNA